MNLRKYTSVLALVSLFTLSCDFGSSDGLPSGMIAMFEESCPDGWSRYTALDGRFARGAEIPGSTGGQDEHVHSFDITARTSKDGAHTHMLDSGENIDVDTGFYGNIGIYKGYLQAFEEGGSPNARARATRALATTDSAGLHDHIISVTGDTQPASSLPPYLDVIYCKKD